jgi:heterogeneous nuclear rnp K-like protein 2
MGTIIGRNGLRIKTIQDTSGARMVAAKDMLPQSTERIVEVHGQPDAISRAIDLIGKSLLEDWERGLGTVLYHPTAGDERSARPPRYTDRASSTSYSAGANGNGNGNGNGNARRSADDGARTSPETSFASQPPPSPPAANLRTQNISIPSDMVGCIIGRGGSKITEIRRLSGSKISIAKAPHDETGERMFTIVGTPEANEKALFLLYNQLESEKERRVGREAHEQED